MAAIGSSTNNILTTGGFTKIDLDKRTQSEDGQKIRLYHLENPTEEKIQRAKEAILKAISLKKREYDEDLDLEYFEDDIQQEPYLLREGKKLSLLSEEEKSEMLNRYSIAVEKRSLQLGLSERFSSEACNLFSVGQHEKALQMYFECLEVTREVRDKEREAGTLYNIGEVFVSINRYEEAITYYKQCVAILETIKTNESFGALVYRGLGFAYQQCGNKNLAHMYYSHYQEICADKNNQLGVREAQHLIQSLGFWEGL